MSSTRLGKNGRITIPIEIRRHLKLKHGDRIEFFIEREGEVRMVACNLDIRALKGILRPPPRRASLKEIDQAIRKSAARTMRKNRHRGELLCDENTLSIS